MIRRNTQKINDHAKFCYKAMKSNERKAIYEEYLSLIKNLCQIKSEKLYQEKMDFLESIRLEIKPKLDELREADEYWDDSQEGEAKRANRRKTDSKNIPTKCYTDHLYKVVI